MGNNTSTISEETIYKQKVTALRKRDGRKAVTVEQKQILRHEAQEEYRLLEERKREEQIRNTAQIWIPLIEQLISSQVRMYTSMRQYECTADVGKYIQEYFLKLGTTYHSNLIA